MENRLRGGIGAGRPTGHRYVRAETLQSFVPQAGRGKEVLQRFRVIFLVIYACHKRGY